MFWVCLFGLKRMTRIARKFQRFREKGGIHIRPHDLQLQGFSERIENNYRWPQNGQSSKGGQTKEGNGVFSILLSQRRASRHQTANITAAPGCVKRIMAELARFAARDFLASNACTPTSYSKMMSRGITLLAKFFEPATADSPSGDRRSISLPCPGSGTWGRWFQAIKMCGGPPV